MNLNRSLQQFFAQVFASLVFCGGVGFLMNANHHFSRRGLVRFEVLSLVVIAIWSGAAWMAHVARSKRTTT